MLVQHTTELIQSECNRWGGEARQLGIIALCQQKQYPVQKLWRVKFPEGGGGKCGGRGPWAGAGGRRQGARGYSFPSPSPLGARLPARVQTPECGAGSSATASRERKRERGMEMVRVPEGRDMDRCHCDVRV